MRPGTVSRAVNELIICDSERPRSPARNSRLETGKAAAPWFAARSISGLTGFASFSSLLSLTLSNTSTKALQQPFVREAGRQLRRAFQPSFWPAGRPSSGAPEEVARAGRCGEQPPGLAATLACGNRRQPGAQLGPRETLPEQPEFLLRAAEGERLQQRLPEDLLCPGDVRKREGAEWKKGLTTISPSHFLLPPSRLKSHVTESASKRGRLLPKAHFPQPFERGPYLISAQAL